MNLSLSCCSTVVVVVAVAIGCGSDTQGSGGTAATGGMGTTGTHLPSGGGTSEPVNSAKGGTSGGATTAKEAAGGSAEASASTSAASSLTTGGASTVTTGSSGVAKGGTTTSSGSKPTSNSNFQGGSSGSSSKTASGPTGGTTNSGGNASVCTSFGAPTKFGSMQSETVEDSILTQTSGIVASREHAKVLYALTDSDRNEIYVMQDSGQALGTLALDVTPNDWEGLSMGVVADGPDLIYVADIGDNNSNRASIVIHRFEEPLESELAPTRPTSITEIESATLVYPNGAKNAEAMFVDPETQDIIIATKDQGTATVYRAPGTAFGASSTTLEEVGKISMNSQISAGDISATGDRIIFRTYDSLLLFPRAGTWKETFAATAVTIPAPAKAEDPQSEGVTFSSDGTAWLSAGEQVLTIYRGVESCN